MARHICQHIMYRLAVAILLTAEIDHPFRHYSARPAPLNIRRSSGSIVPPPHCRAGSWVLLDPSIHDEVPALFPKRKHIVVATRLNYKEGVGIWRQRCICEDGPKGRIEVCATLSRAAAACRGHGLTFLPGDRAGRGAAQCRG